MLLTGISAATVRLVRQGELDDAGVGDPDEQGVEHAIAERWHSPVAAGFGAFFGSAPLSAANARGSVVVPAHDPC